jgi:hypothetical protein
MDWVAEYTVIIIHLEWNMIFFARRMEQSLHMTRTVKEFMSSLPVSFGMLGIVLKKSSTTERSIFLMFSCSWNY